MKKILLLPLVCLFFVGCEEEPPAPGADTKIAVTCNRDKGDPFLVGEDIILTIAMETNPAVGVNSFTIFKDGDTIFTRNDYVTNNVNFEFRYKTVQDDLDPSESVFRFELIDRDLITKTAEVTVTVAVDFPITVQGLDPNPGWDMVNDVEVDGTTEAETDILQFSEAVGTETMVYYTSLNGAKFYDATDTGIDFFDINFSQAELEAAIVGITPVDTVLIAIQGFGSTPLPFPLVVNLRNGQGWAWIDRSNVQGSAIGYRKGKE